MKAKNDPRHEARRLAINFIYSQALGNTSKDTTLIKDALQITDYNRDIFKQITSNYTKNLKEVQTISTEGLSSWNKDQLLELDLIIINIAILEMMILKITPVKVAVDEAVELAKEFGGEKSNKFVNGVLAKIIKDNHLD